MQGRSRPVRVRRNEPWSDIVPEGHSMPAMVDEDDLELA